MPDNESATLLVRWRGGDQQAATELVQRFTVRLLALARSQLSDKLARRVDPEDVVQSAYRSFFTGARADRYEVRGSGDLWQLLAAITMHKLHHQVARHTAGKRAVDREQGFGGEDGRCGLHAELVARDPSPADAAGMVDELDHLMRDLAPLHRRMVEMRLEGYALQEIADATARSERLVRRVLDRLKARLQQCQRQHALN
jgi:RNA polymerase sigma-70 factor (ECF subfamily)